MSREREKRNAGISYDAAVAGMVLLENDGALPISRKGEIALYGVGAIRTVRGGTGSGDPFNGGLSGGGDALVDQSPRYHINILPAFQAAGYRIVNEKELQAIAEEYDRQKRQVADQVMGTFMFPEPNLDEETVKQTAAACNTAIMILSRNSGEGTDRSMRKSFGDIELGDYRLAAREKHNLDLLRKYFATLIIVLNVGGVVDITEIKQYKPNSILLMGLAGQEGGVAVRDVLNGTVTPSGKLTDTWAACYEDYPASATFAYNDHNVELEKYEEDIYVGYRYFDSFQKTPVYPFGYGKSYTEFEVCTEKAVAEEKTARFWVRVSNKGNMPGQEVVQIYVSSYNTGLPMPYQELKAWKKTRKLLPGEEELLEIPVALEDLKCFVEEDNSWQVRKGIYIFRIGTSSQDTVATAKLHIQESSIIEFVSEALPLKETLERKSICYECAPETLYPQLPLWKMKKVDIFCTDHRKTGESVITYTYDAAYPQTLPYETVQVLEKEEVNWEAFLQDKIDAKQLVAAWTDEELAAFNCGTGWGIADENNPVVGGSSETVPGAAGETTGILYDTYGIPSMILADGPGGIRVKQEFDATNLNTGKKEHVEHYCTAWPCGTLLAQSFDENVLKRVGEAIAVEMQEIGVHILLAPGMNIHRDPLCGRNFEYYSEDPLVSGKMAAALVQGIQDCGYGTGACIKHYAANNQESNRSAVDEWISQRALREIYLRGFEIAVKESQPYAIMTSYNLINKVPTADSYDLCTQIARKEWGFEGLLMTDWNGGSSSADKSMHAGNDLIMPGGKSKVRQILLALKKIEPQFDERGQVLFTKVFEQFPFLETHWNSFVPDINGDQVVRATLGEGHLAKVQDGQIYADEQPIWMKATDKLEFLRHRGEDIPVRTAPLTTEYASVDQDGTAILYRGRYEGFHAICRGDLQQCSMHILYVLKRIYHPINGNAEDKTMDEIQEV